VTTPAEASAVVWFNPACSTCRLAVGALEESGEPFVVRRYLEDPPSVAERADVLDRLGLEPWDITRAADAVGLGGGGGGASGAGSA